MIYYAACIIFIRRYRQRKQFIFIILWISISILHTVWLFVRYLQVYFICYCIIVEMCL